VFTLPFLLLRNPYTAIVSCHNQDLGVGLLAAVGIAHH
jgi:hypothetical protein